jgi:hypothetical protein
VRVNQQNKTMLITSVQKTLHELASLLSQLTNDDYIFPCQGLSGATIGEHTRHIIEMFQCLYNQYESNEVNYDLRERNYQIQTDIIFAQSAINAIVSQLEMPNKTLYLHQNIDGENLIIETNYNRELLYNLEHCIHHQALIKVALIQNSNLIVDQNFGVARSTIEYRKQCAQ